MSDATTSERTGCSPQRGLIDRHFAGRIRARAERRLREHLPGCPACRSYYARHLLLAQLDPSALDSRDRLARGLGIRSARPTAGPVGWLALATLAALLLVVLLWPTRVAPPGDEAPGFTARGGAAPTTELLVYRVGQGLVEGEILSTDELAIAYRNEACRRRLMVFGVDDRGAVYWYHPAWQDPAANPTAIPIRSGPGIHELPEAVKHEIRGSRLTIHGIFLDRPLTVRQVEQMIPGIRPGEPLGLEDAEERRVKLLVRHRAD
jgi:hypothetical protein